MRKRVCVRNSRVCVRNSISLWSLCTHTLTDTRTSLSLTHTHTHTHTHTPRGGRQRPHTAVAPAQQSTAPTPPPPPHPVTALHPPHPLPHVRSRHLSLRRAMATLPSSWASSCVGKGVSAGNGKRVRARGGESRCRYGCGATGRCAIRPQAEPAFAFSSAFNVLLMCC